MMTELEALRDALGAIAGVASCKIGLEENITPADYPLIRIVPSLLADGEVIGRRRADLLVYFGQPIQPFDDTPDSGGRVRLEKRYAALFSMEVSIRSVLALHGGYYQETITDEDRLDTYKMMAVRAQLDC